MQGNGLKKIKEENKLVILRGFAEIGFADFLKITRITVLPARYPGFSSNLVIC
jgi:hypothetical protein